MGVDLDEFEMLLCNLFVTMLHLSQCCSTMALNSNHLAKIRARQENLERMSEYVHAELRQHA
jgi:hypothetical protein